MDYERIQKPLPQGAGLSPGKLRSMLLGVEKRRKEEEELESVFSSTSDAADTGIGSPEDCKHVIECSSSSLPELTNSQMATDHRLKEFAVTNSRLRCEEDSSLVVDYDSGQDNANVLSSAFEFQKAERAAHRVPLAPFSKPAPSKWDDAQKWIASPTYNRPKSGQSQAQQVVGLRKGFLGYGNRQVSSKVVVEVPDQKCEEAETKRIDLNQAKKEVGGQKLVTWGSDPDPVADSFAIANLAVSLSQHDATMTIHSATTFIPPPSTVRSVSMRDMGTEMTPIPSQEPSRTGTPVRPATPLRSPNSSRPSTPQRGAAGSSPVETVGYQVNSNKTEPPEKELQSRTRREIVALGKQLGKMNIAAWASKTEEDKEASSSLKTISTDQPHPAKSAVENRASAWEEAEKAKYVARCKREEIKIQAWENHQKAKAEAEMRKMEVEIERMKARAHDKLLNKLAAMRHKAEEKRAAAEAKRNRQAARTEEQAESIRRTGKIPSSWSCSCCSWCF